MQSPLLLLLVAMPSLALSPSYYVQIPRILLSSECKNVNISIAPTGRRLANVRKQDVVGARNIQISPEGDNLCYDSSHIFGWNFGCSQLYTLGLRGTSPSTLLPQRISWGHGGNFEQCAFFPHNDSLLLFASSVDVRLSDVVRQQMQAAANNATFDHRCGEAERLLQALVKEHCQKRWWSTGIEHCEWLNARHYLTEELVQRLEPQNDIYLAHRRNPMEVIRRLTTEHGFDGFPVVSRDEQTIYYTSMRSGNAELWRMDAVDGANKKQLTDSPHWWKLRPALSPADGNTLIYECIPLAATDYPTFQAELTRHNFYNRSASRLCSLALNGADEAPIAAVTEIVFSNETLFQFSSPTFAPSTNKNGLPKIVFSARSSAVLLNAPDTALFMSNLDGSELEQLVDIRAKNNFATFASDKHLTWLSSSRPDADMHDQHLYRADWLGNEQKQKNTLTKNSSTTLTTKVVHVSNIVQLTHVPSHTGVARPQFSASGESILFKWWRQNVNNSAAQGGREISEIWRIGPICSEEAAASLNVWRDPRCATRGQQRVSSVLEYASGGTATFGDDESFIVYAMQITSGASNDHQQSAKRVVAPLQWQRPPSLDVLSPTSFVSSMLTHNMDIYKFNALGQMVHPLVQNRGFDGEPTIHVHNDSHCQMVFTSAGAGGELDLWTGNVCARTMAYSGAVYNKDGAAAQFKRLLRRRGYEGEASFSTNGEKLVFTGSLHGGAKHGINKNNATAERVDIMCALLEGTATTELFSVNADGTGLRQLTSLGAVTRSAQFLPDGQHIVFSSNFETRTRTSLYVMHQSGTGIRKVRIDGIQADHNNNTHAMFPCIKTAKDGSVLIAWTSNHNSPEFNVFLGTVELRSGEVGNREKARVPQ